MSKDYSKTEDKFLKDTSDQAMAAALSTLQNQMTSMQDAMTKIVSSLQDKDVVDEFVRDDIGQAEGFKQLLLDRASRNADNAKMVQADEKNYAKGMDALIFKSMLDEMGRKAERHDSYLAERQQMFNAYITHYTTQHTDERVQKAAIYSPEIQGGSAIGDKK